MLKKLRLKIPVEKIDEPIIYKIVTLYNLKPNILEANLNSGAPGEVLISLEGNPADLEKGLLYLRELDILVQEL